MSPRHSSISVLTMRIKEKIIFKSVTTEANENCDTEMTRAYVPQHPAGDLALLSHLQRLLVERVVAREDAPQLSVLRQLRDGQKRKRRLLNNNAEMRHRLCLFPLCPDPFIIKSSSWRYI